VATATHAAPGGAAAVVKELKRPYVLVFAFLAVVTFVEVQIPTLGTALGISAGLQTFFLLVSAAIKAAMVGLYYMHLRYEPRILKLLPLGPLAFVLALLIVVMLH